MTLNKHCINGLGYGFFGSCPTCNLLVVGASLGGNILHIYTLSLWKQHNAGKIILYNCWYHNYNTLNEHQTIFISTSSVLLVILHTKHLHEFSETGIFFHKMIKSLHNVDPT